jgi:DNA-binding transcriptional ArsR family regulator
LSKVFNDVERMPMHNPGYDVVCNRGKKVDIKSSCKRNDGVWAFHIARNEIADYFLCLAFDNREDLNPLHAWLIPGSVVNHLTAASVSLATIHKWDEYRIDTSKIVEGCDSMRTARDETPVPTSRLPPTSSRLSVLAYLEAGLNPAKIAVKMNLSDSTIQYHISALKKQGTIHKVGYGTWEILESPVEEKKTPRGSTRVGTAETPQPRRHPREISQVSLTRFQQDAVRGHAFRTRFQVPHNLRNWNNEKRTQYLTAHGIPFKHLKIGGEGQRILVKDRKVWLLNKAIIIYDTASYFAEAALEAKSKAIATHLSIIKHIERLLHTSFLVGSDYKFKVSSQHYALIYNALAKQYNEEGEKLEIRTAKGAWLLIDDSYNMQELETIHPTTAMTDNKKVLGFFNSLKDNPLTTDFIFEAMSGIQQSQQTITDNQMLYATNIESHIGVIKELGSGVRDLTAIIKQGR